MASSYWTCLSIPLELCQRPLEKAVQYLLLPNHNLNAKVLNATSVTAVLRGPLLSSVLLPPSHSSDPLALLALEYLDVGATTACFSCKGLGGI